MFKNCGLVLGLFVSVLPLKALAFSTDFAYTQGRVGIGTASPSAQLDVKGDIKFGANEDVFAAGGADSLRLIHGSVNASGIIDVGNSGPGFSVVKLATTGQYQIIFSPA